MKRVAIVNGVAHQVKYNQHLAKKYAELGYQVKEFNFNWLLLFCCHLHKKLDNQVQDIVENHDVIHCQSGGYFPIVNYYSQKNHSKPFVFETPVLKSTTGTLLSGLSLAKSYKDIADNTTVQKALDTFCFTPPWVSLTLGNIRTLKERNLCLILASHADTVSDNRGNEDILHHTFADGKHARLFYDNDFKVVVDFLAQFESNKKI